MKRKTVFITGMGGYVGQLLARELDRGTWCGKFYGMDVAEPLYKFKKGEFRQLDITDPAVGKWIAEIQPDVIVHLAFVVEAMRDRERMRQINVGGTRKILDAAARANTAQVLVASSATAYGAWPDNPVPLVEDSPIRKHPTFDYASHKADTEVMMQAWQGEHPEQDLCIIRPCVIYGPNVKNYINELFTLPFAMAPKNFNCRFQFVHEDDVVAAIMHLLKKNRRGPFNLAPPDVMDIGEINALTKKVVIPLSDRMMGLAFKATWSLGTPFLRVPASFLDYVRYPWIVDSRKLMDTGFQFTYSTRETMEIMLRAKGAIK